MRIVHIAILAPLLMISGTSFLATAQRPGDEAPKVKPEPKGKGPVRRSVAPTVRLVTPTTGSLAVYAESNADLLLEPLKLVKPPRRARSESLEVTVPNGQHFVIFNELQPGLYRVAGTLAKHHPKETTINIKANEYFAVTLEFAPIVYSVTINTNVGTGDVRYALEGEPLNRVAAILNGKVRLSLAVGKYTLAISTTEFGYETRRDSILVNNNQVVEMNLNRTIISRDPFSANWTKSGLQEWELPVGWQDEKQRLLVKGVGVALPRQQGYRHYKDFKLTTTAKMNNGVALSFALRAQDSLSYYLVQLTGAKSDEPHMLRLFLVNSGVARRIMGIPIPGSAARPMDAGRFITVSIKMIDYDITVEIGDTDSGAPYPLGRLTDAEHSLAVGAVGIVARDNEENFIGPFIVCTGEACFRE
jgi:hypothetical protein